MRLNLYTATCSLLAYGITAINLPYDLQPEATGVESAALAQTYEDEYSHDLS